ncbi:MAG: dihydroorotate dehydrogenase electron transfer subunit [Lachnospiraceae bacterium]|nr:dihydroorotate dehydrogenase electron transfer subunit [Lachnospiraceae bacterium]
MKQKQNAKVISQREIAPQIYDMWIETSLCEQAKPGQFICIYPKNKSTLLPRPISICQVDTAKQALRVVYRIAGQGTAEFSEYKEGDAIAILGTLGNGFPVEEAKGKKVFLMGGGIGIPPMVDLARVLTEKMGMAKEDVQVIVGYRDDKLFLKEDLEKYATVVIATEDGSVGTKGNVMDAISENGLQADVIFSCGPMPMLRAIKRYAEEKGIDAYLSLEERMACGVGACLGCVAKTKNVDHHSHVHNARICTDGPVFEAKEVDI